MSLLLDALKKTEQTRQGVAQEGASTPSELARSAGHRLFTAKAVPARGKLGIIPLAIIGGLLLAAGGGYYIWREISSLATQSSPTPPILVDETAHQTTATANKPVAANAANTPSENAGGEQDHPSKIVASEVATAEKLESSPPATAPRSAAVKSTQALHVERNKKRGEAVDPTLLAAWQAYSNGDFATAWQLYRTALQRDAKNRDALLGMAAIARQQGRDDVAAQYYGHVLALDPRDPAAHAGMSTLASGDAASTESKLKLQLAYRPDAAALHFALGNLYAEQSRWGEANQSYLNAYKRNPDDAQFAFNLAVSLDHLGQSKLAAQHYQHALQLDRAGTSGINREQVQQRVNELMAP